MSSAPRSLKRRDFVAACLGMLAAPIMRMGTSRRALDTNELFLEAAEQELKASRIRSAKSYLDQIQRHSGDIFTRESMLVSRYLRALAVVHRDANNIEAAIGAYDQLQATSREMNNISLFGEAIIGKMMILINNDRLRVAERILLDYGSILESIPAPAFKAEYDNWRACLLERRNEIEAARDIMAKSVIPLSEHHEPEELQIARHAVSSRLALAGPNRKWRLAEIGLEKAATLITPATPLLRQGQFVQGKALFELRAGDAESALQLAGEAERIFEADGIVSHQLRRLREGLGES